MTKIWYLLIEEKEEGPYSLSEIRSDTRVTLDTLVWREGFPDWIPLKKIKELRKYFEPAKEKNDKENAALKKISPQAELVLDYNFDPTPFLLILLIIIALGLYFFYHS